MASLFFFFFGEDESNEREIMKKEKIINLTCSVMYFYDVSHYKYIQIINIVNSTRNFIVNMSWYEIKIYELAYYVINGAIKERRV